MRCLMVNMEYLKALGMTADDIKTMDDYYEYLKAVKENDLNGNGDATTKCRCLCVGSDTAVGMYCLIWPIPADTRSRMTAPVICGYR